MKNAYKFHFVNKVAGRIFLRINFFIDTNQPTFSHWINFVLKLLITINIDTTLKMKQYPKSDFQCCTILIQCWCPTLKQHKSTLHNIDATVFQHCKMLFQRCFNVDMTFSQRCFNVTLTSVKGISTPIWLVKSMDLQKDW